MDPAEEPVDVVDEEDRVVTTVTRRELRERGLLHRCTYVLVRNGAGEILVHRRTETKDVHPGAYDVFAGGVCAAGESYDDCARREAAEEVGVEGAELRFLFRHRYRGPDAQAWGAVYEVRWDGPVRPQASEVAWSAWVGPAELERMLGTLPFCPDSREVFARLGATGRLGAGPPGSSASPGAISCG
jgi:8-oxo-dGTP pyrophosphatase MutT (NUDIX family)